MGVCLGIFMAEWIFFRLEPHTFLLFFLEKSVNTQFEELLQFYVGMSTFFWIQNTWTHNQWKKQRRKVLDHVTSERTISTYIFIINILIKATQTCTVQIILHNMISLRLKGIIVIINFMFFWKGTNNGVGSA